MFSSKLHEYLQPKRHLLLEPEVRYYEPFIKPLLDEPGSTYRYTTLGAHPHHYWDTWKVIMDDPTMFPPSTKPPLSDDEPRPYDPSLLMIGNLARNYGAFRRSNSVNYSSMILQQMVWAMLRGDMLHRDGRARMLMWAPESEAYLLFPESENARQSTNVALDMGASVTKVVGMQQSYETATSSVRRRRRRVRLMEDFVSARVQGAMHEKGMQQPEGRKFLLSEPPPIAGEPSISGAMEEVVESEPPAPVPEEWSTLTPLELKRAKARAKYWERKEKAVQQAASKVADTSDPNVADAVMAKELPTAGRESPSENDELVMSEAYKQELEAKFVNPLIPTIRNAHELRAALGDVWARLTKLKTEVPGRSHGHKASTKEKALLDTIEFPQSTAVGSGFSSLRQRIALTCLVLDLDLRIVRLEASLKMLQDEGIDPMDLIKLRDDILALDHESELWKAERENVYSDAIDSQLALFTSPPLITIEARQFEPLKAEPHEVWPRNNLMLLDIMPNDTDLSVPGLANAAEGVKVCKMLATTIMAHRAKPLPFALERLAPNAAQDLIPLVPAITDPRKGGRLNPNNVRARMVTPAMLEGLVKAWAEWPFKPSTLELELSAGSDAPADESAESADGSTEYAVSEH